MSWHLLEKVLDEVSKQSTFFGKVWITLLFVFRVIAVTRMGDTVYADEQAAFKCNIKQPGCENVCFNDFSPISHVRFWGFQIIIVATPSMMFMVYAAHKVSQLPHGCKLVGRKVEISRQSSKKKTSKLQSGRTVKSSFPDATTTTSKPTTKRATESRNWNKRKFDAVARWKTVANPIPLTEAGTGRNISESWKCEREKGDQDSPPSYYEKSPEIFCEEIRISDIPLRKEDNNRKSFKNHYNSFSSTSQQIPINEISYFPYFPLHRSQSDGNIVNTEMIIAGQPNSRRRRLSADLCNFAKVDEESFVDKSPPHYSVIQLSKLADLNDPNHVWQNNVHSALPMNLIQLGSAFEGISIGRATPTIGKCSSKSLYSSFRSKTNTYKTASVLLRKHNINRHSPFTHRDISQHSAKDRHSVNISDKDKNRPGLSKSALTQKGIISGGPSITRKRKLQYTTLSHQTGYTRIGKRLESIQKGIAIAYFLQSVTRLLLETAFLLMQYLIFRFDVPELVKCDRWPCPNTVDCFVSRPNEKSVMLYFMFGVTACCIALTLLELMTLIMRQCQETQEEKKKQQASKLCESLQEVEGKPTKGERPIGKIDFTRNPHLLERYANKVQRHSIDLYEESESSSETKSTKSSRSETDTDDLQDSYNSGDISEMLENEMEAADFNNEQNDAVDAGYV